MNPAPRYFQLQQNPEASDTVLTCRWYLTGENQEMMHRRIPNLLKAVAEYWKFWILQFSSCSYGSNAITINSGASNLLILLYLSSYSEAFWLQLYKKRIPIRIFLSRSECYWRTTWFYLLLNTDLSNSNPLFTHCRLLMLLFKPAVEASASRLQQTW